MGYESTRCPKCGVAIGEPVASIAGSVMGDELVRTYYFCGTCQVYFIEHYRDSFTMGDSSELSGELPKAKGDALIAVIRRCERPWDKRCRCAAHMEYFGDALD